jgi:hypothetical protein
MDGLAVQWTARRTAGSPGRRRESARRRDPLPSRRPRPRYGAHRAAPTRGIRSSRAALAALAEGCIVAAGIARRVGNAELSTLAAKRATVAAALTDRPELASLSGMTRVGALLRLGARHRAHTVLASELTSAEPHADPSATDTAPAEGYGMLHVTGARVASRSATSTDERETTSSVGLSNRQRPSEGRVWVKGSWLQRDVTWRRQLIYWAAAKRKRIPHQWPHPQPCRRFGYQQQHHSTW